MGLPQVVRVYIYQSEHWRRLLRPGLRRRDLLQEAGKKNNDKADTSKLN